MQGNGVEKSQLVQPFQAQYEHIHLRRQPNSEIVEEKIVGTISRDSHGRERTQERREHDSGETPEVLIYDPVRGMHYTVDVRSNSILYQYSVPENGFMAWTWGVGESRVAIPLVPPNRQPDLGVKEIEGLWCEGYQLNGPGEAVIEYWYARDLNQIMLVLITSETEEQSWRLFDIHQTEPDSHLFIVPEGS